MTSITESARRAFDLTVHHRFTFCRSAWAIVGDGQERYVVPAAALTERIPFTQDREERLDQYEAWCRKWIPDSGRILRCPTVVNMMDF